MREGKGQWATQQGPPRTFLLLTNVSGGSGREIPCVAVGVGNGLIGCQQSSSSSGLTFLHFEQSAIHNERLCCDGECIS